MHSHTCRDRDELADSGKLSHDALRAQLEAKTYGAFRAQARSRMRRGEPPSLGRTGALSGRASVHQRLRWRPKNKTEKGTEKKNKRRRFWRFDGLMSSRTLMMAMMKEMMMMVKMMISMMMMLCRICHAEGLVMVCVCLFGHAFRGSRVRIGFVCSALHGGYTDSVVCWVY